MKPIYLIAVSAVIFTILSGFEIYRNSEIHRSTGPDFGYCGDAASGFQTCASCHIGAPVRNLDAVISSDIPATGYLPDSTYTFSVTISEEKLSRYGFQISAQNAKGEFLGQLLVTDPITTQLNPENEHYINHTYEGIGFPGGIGKWMFRWIAPAKGSGEVIFYGAFLFSNESDTPTGDIVGTSSLTASEDGLLNTNHEGQRSNSAILSIYPNPTSEILNYALDLKNSSVLSGLVIHADGKIISAISQKEIAASKHHLTIPISLLEPGMYYLQLNINHENVSKCFWINR